MSPFSSFLTSRFQTSLTAANGPRLQTPGGLTVGHLPLIIAFDALSGGQMWTIPRGTEPDGGDVHFDASGRFLVVSNDDESRSPLLAMPDGAPLERMKPPSALAPDAREMVTQLPASSTGGGINCLIRRGEGRPMLTFGKTSGPTVRIGSSSTPTADFWRQAVPGTPILIFRS